MKQNVIQKYGLLIFMGLGLGWSGLYGAHVVDLSNKDGVARQVNILDFYIQNLEKESNIADLATIFSVVSIQHLQQLVAARLQSSYNVKKTFNGIGSVQQASKIIGTSGDADTAYKNVTIYLSTLLGAVNVYGGISSIYYKKYYQNLALVLTKTVKAFITTKIESSKQVAKLLNDALGVNSNKANEKADQLGVRLEQLGAFFTKSDAKSLSMLATKESSNQLPGAENIRAYAASAAKNEVPYNKNFGLSLYAYLSYAGAVSKDQQILLCMQACADMFDVNVLLELSQRGDISGLYNAILQADKKLNEPARLVASIFFRLLQGNEVCKYLYSFNDASAILNLQLEETVYLQDTDAAKATQAFGIGVRGLLSAAHAAGKSYDQLIDQLQLATGTDGFSVLAAQSAAGAGVVESKNLDDSDDLDIHIAPAAVAQQRVARKNAVLQHEEVKKLLAQLGSALLQSEQWTLQSQINRDDSDLSSVIAYLKILQQQQKYASNKDLQALLPLLQAVQSRYQTDAVDVKLDDLQSLVQETITNVKVQADFEAKQQVIEEQEAMEEQLRLQAEAERNALIEAEYDAKSKEAAAKLIQAQARRKQAVQKVKQLKQQKASATAQAQAQAEEQAAQQALDEAQKALAEAREAAKLAAQAATRDGVLTNIADFSVARNQELEDFLSDSEGDDSLKAKKALAQAKGAKKPTNEELLAMQADARKQKAAKSMTNSKKSKAQRIKQAEAKKAQLQEESAKNEKSLATIKAAVKKWIDKKKKASLSAAEAAELVKAQKDQARVQKRQAEFEALLAQAEADLVVAQAEVVPGKKDQVDQGAGNGNSSDISSVGSDDADDSGDEVETKAEPSTPVKTVIIKEPKKFIVNGNLELLHKGGTLVSALSGTVKPFVDEYLKSNPTTPDQYQVNMKAALQEIPGSIV